MRRVVLIDSKNLLYRMQAVFNNLSRQDGFPTGALFGCLSTMLNISKRFPDAAIVWVWDGRGDTWRHKFMGSFPQIEVHNEKKKKYVGYKGQRHKNIPKQKSKYPETPRERALLQLPVLQLILRGAGIRSLEVESLECDDLIAMLTTRIHELDKNVEVIIHSGDHDFYQLLSKRVKILTRVKAGKAEMVTKKMVIEKYGVRPRNWAKFRAFTGDSSDNISHLKNIGKVVAKKLLKAGLDPSVVNLPINEYVEKKYKKVFPDGVQKVWPALCGNYKLCKLVTDIDSDILSEEVRKDLEEMFSRFTSVRRFKRSKTGKTSHAFRRVGLLLSQYELASILGRRHILFSIP
jgi:5'-3' exonuclease